MDRPLKILGVEPFTTIAGHHEWFATRISEGLAARGHDMTLLTYGGVDDDRVRKRTHLTVLDAVLDSNANSDVLRIRAKRISVPSLPRRKRILMELRTYSTAFTLLGPGKYDVVHFFDAHPTVLLFAIHFFLWRASAKGTVIVANYHYSRGLGPATRLWEATKDAFHRKVLASLIKRRLDGLFVLDASFKAELMNYLKLAEQIGDRIFVLPHGMDVEEPTYSRSDARSRLNAGFGETLLLLFGVLREDKKADIAIQAIKGLPSCRLLIAGPPGDLDDITIQALLRQYACQKSVSVEIGYIEESRMRDYFLAADAVLLPYSKSFRGQSGILTHACTHGRCVIASDVGGVGQMVKKYGIGLTVEAENVEGLRQAILRFLALTPEERARMEMQSKLLASRQSWDAVCSQLESYYHLLLAGHSKPRALEK